MSVSSRFVLAAAVTVVAIALAGGIGTAVVGTVDGVVNSYVTYEGALDVGRIEATFHPGARDLTERGRLTDGVGEMTVPTRDSELIATWAALHMLPWIVVLLCGSIIIPVFAAVARSRPLPRSAPRRFAIAGWLALGAVVVDSLLRYSVEEGAKTAALMTQPSVAASGLRVPLLALLPGLAAIVVAGWLRRIDARSTSPALPTDPPQRDESRAIDVHA